MKISIPAHLNNPEFKELLRAAHELRSNTKHFDEHLGYGNRKAKKYSEQRMDEILSQYIICENDTEKQ